jgi:hypothetical protein
VKEESSPANDEVKLVLCVRRLSARALREGKGDIQRATPQDHSGALARRARNTRLTLGKTHNAATIWLAHPSLLQTEILPEFDLDPVADHFNVVVSGQPGETVSSSVHKTGFRRMFLRENACGMENHGAGAAPGFS